MARILAVALAFLLAAAQPAAAQRVALVIGNGAYREAPALANPAADARGMAAALTRLGFSVDTLIDADRPAMERAIRRFGEAATGAEAALVYYAGHAVEVAGRNFLIPVTAEIRSDRDLPFETIDFDAVMAQLEGRARVILIFLDACRDNPFRLRLMAGATRGVASPGLAAVRGPVGTLVAFATAPGQVASDGRGQNSPFTAALLAHIETPALEIRPMLGRVRQTVREATGGAQVPWENASLEGEFFFRAPPAPPVVAALPAPAQVPSAPRATPDGDQGAERRAWEAERLFWESVKDSRDAAELRAYLRRYPDGVFADLARQRIAALERVAPPSRTPEPSQSPRAPPPAAPAPPAATPVPAAPVPAPAASLPRPPPPPEPAPQREAAARVPPPPAQPPVIQQPPTQPQAAARPPPPPPAAPPAASPSGRGGTTRLLTHVVPLPPGTWRETSRWVEDSRPNAFGRSNQIHQVVLVQEREGRPVAAIWLRAIDSFGSTTGWSSVGNCQGGDGRVAANVSANTGTQVDCWQVRRRRVTTNPLGRVFGEATVLAAQHAVGDARTLLQVDYAFATVAAERVAAWAPSAQEALLRGFNGRGGLTEGLPAP